MVAFADRFHAWIRERATLVSLVGIAAVSLACFWVVKPTNFSGYDEWLTIDLASHGVLSMPYQSRPLILLFFLPGAFPRLPGLAGYWWAQWAYLASTGVLTFLLVRRLRGASGWTAFVAGVAAAVWAPADHLRLDVVLGRGYAGATAAVLFVLVLFVESLRTRRRPGIVLACLFAILLPLATEAVLPLLLLGCGLPWLMDVGGRERRREGAFAFAVGFACLSTAWRFRPGVPSTYQLSALRLDTQPISILKRLAGLVTAHLAPLFRVDLADLADRSVVLGLFVFMGAAWMVGWSFRNSRREAPRDALRLAIVGIAGACAAYGTFALSPAMRTYDRTQFLAAPGVGILLAGVMGFAVSPLPPRARPWILAALAAWVVAVSASRTASLQREWDHTSYWPAQNDSLVALTDLVPMTRPDTLLVLIDEAGAWPANFTFRHAIRHLYGGSSHGFVPQALDFLYPGRFAVEGFHYTPWTVIQGPWQAPPTLHRYDQMIVLRLHEDGRLEWLKDWPRAVLPDLPPGASYAPRANIVRDAPLPPERSILARH